VRADLAKRSAEDAPPSPDIAVIGTAMSEGFDGQSGGTTAFGIDPVHAAAGGGGGDLAGTGHRLTSDRLRVSSMMLASCVETYPGGLCSILSGGWGRLTTPELPADQQLAGLLIVEANGVPAGEYSMHFALLGPTGDRVGRTSFPVTVETPGEVLRFSMFVPLEVHLKTLGIHTLVASTDLGDLLSIPLAVGND
jgi:hypothetical protein